MKGRKMLIKRSSSSFQRIANIGKLSKHGDKLSVQGWIKNVRKLKENIFLDISDGSTSGKFQIVLPKRDAKIKITSGSIIRAIGSIQIAPNGHYELHADNVTKLSDGNLALGFPFTPNQQHSPEYIRNYMHLRSRDDIFAAAMRVRHKAQKAINDCMDELGFLHIHTPILTTNDCEGAGEVFTVQPNSYDLLKQMKRVGIPLEQSYFDEKVYLSVSGQLHLEAMSYGLGNTYNFAPAFRAENSKSPLHLSEFYMFEAELVYVEQMDELTVFIEDLIKRITQKLLDNCNADLNVCQKNVGVQEVERNYNWLLSKWNILTYDEAVKIIERYSYKFKGDVKLTEGFSKEQELFLVGHCGTPVFITEWPIEQKPFYMKVLRNNPKRVHALDLLMPNVGELVGGSLRECDWERLSAHPRLPKGIEWYLDLRKYGGIPTAGFGMGFERYLQLMTGIRNIRDVIPYPRYPHSCKL